MPARFAVNFTQKAEQDIEEIWGFIAEDSPDEAARFVRHLEKQVGTLERFPEKCRLIPENEQLRTRYRQLIYGHYRMIFKISDRTVYLIRVIHAARLLESLILKEDY